MACTVIRFPHGDQVALKGMTLFVGVSHVLANAVRWQAGTNIAVEAVEGAAYVGTLLQNVGGFKIGWSGSCLTKDVLQNRGMGGRRT